jgi:Mn2+/Fe2+ NRAMP family transporter
MPSEADELQMLLVLAGIVMSGSATVCYSAWAEERGMGLFGLVKRTGRRLTPREIEPQSDIEVERMFGWLRINRINVALAYILGGLVCLSTFVLGFAVLGQEQADLKGAKMAEELSWMMTKVVGAPARIVFYVGAWAAVCSTAIGILDGGSRMYVQPLRRAAPRLFARLSFTAWQKVVMTLMVLGCCVIFVLVPDALRLVMWMGIVDAPLVGVLMLSYAHLAGRQLPRAYRSGSLWTLVMSLIGVLYLVLGACYVFLVFRQLYGV